MLTILDQFSASERGKVWLDAYERHYREVFSRRYVRIMTMEPGLNAIPVLTRKSFFA